MEYNSQNNTKKKQMQEILILEDYTAKKNKLDFSENLSSENDTPILKADEWVATNDITECKKAFKSMASRIREIAGADSETRVQLHTSDGTMLEFA